MDLPLYDAGNDEFAPGDVAGDQEPAADERRLNRDKEIEAFTYAENDR